MSLRAACLVLGLVTLAAGTAEADPQGLYGGVSAGWSHLDQLDSGGSALSFSAKPHTGFAGTGRLGYAFGPLRVEGELGYRHHRIDALSIANDGGLGARLGVGSLAGANTSPGGSVTALSFMANGLYDVAHFGSLTPYVGLGVGGADIGLNSLKVNGVTIADGSDLVFAYQGIAGLRYRLDDQLSLGVSYRYFATLDPSFKDASGVPFRIGYASHNVLLDFVYYFGGAPGGRAAAASTPTEPAWRSTMSTAAAAPPPAPPPPRPPVRTAVEPPAAPAVAPPAPPPPPLPAAVSAPAPTPRTFMVFFDFGKAMLTAAGARTVEEAARTVKSQGAARIDLTGYSDGGAANLALAQRRAEAVRSYLIKLGVASGAITVTDRHAPVQAQGRRIEIII